jgi:TatD DNase family protein
MIIVDAHAHLDHRLIYPEKIDEVIENSRKNHVKVIITNGINPETNRLTLELQTKYKDIVKAALGIYPIDALKTEMKRGDYPLKTNDFDFDEELEFIEKHKGKIVAVGEIGLDYFWDSTQHEQQKENFKKLLELAEKIKKPVIVHSRKAETDTVDILEQYKMKKVVMHCFSGNSTLVKKIQDNNWHFTIPCNIVRSEQFQRIVRTTNISRLLTETDAPFLSPFKDKMNEPMFIIETIKKIAEIKGMDPEEVANNIFMNYQNLFL